jgi:ribonuclease HI
MLESCTDLRKLIVAVVELLRLWWCCDTKQPVTIVTRAPKRGYPPLLYASRARADAADSCYVDGSARDGTRCGVGLYYADGHALNRAAAVDVAAAAGASNVAEVAAIFAALAAHPRRRPLRLFSDSATALRCVAAAHARGAAADLPLAAPGPGLARAAAALLALRGAETTLAKVAAHADVEGNRVADALAEIGAERRDDVLDVPAAFYGARAGRARLATAALQLRYLLRHA